MTSEVIHGTTGVSGKGKLTIKPYSFKHPQIGEDYADKTWKLLSTAIREIHNKNAGHLSFEELYRNGYNMVLHKYGDKLYAGLKEVVEEHLITVRARIEAQGKDFNFLLELNTAWNDHKLSMLMIRDILMYMDRAYVPPKNLKPVYELGLSIFLKQIVRAPKITGRLLVSLLQLIDLERKGEIIDKALFKNLTQMLVSVSTNKDVYEEDFEKAFLATSRDFYRLEAQAFLTGNTCPDYMKKADLRLNEEAERVSQYLDPSSESKIRAVVERELVSNHMQTVMDMEQSGIVSMLRDLKVDDLSRMYGLFGRVVGGHQLMKDRISAFVEAAGNDLVARTKKEKNPLEYIAQLLDMKKTYDMLLVRAFLDDKGFHFSVNKAFEKFINGFSRSPEFLSLFIDKNLKGGNKEKASDEDLDLTLNSAMEIFRYLQEKDVFEKYYKQHLARRLLQERSSSDDWERSMIQKLKAECGYQFTSKLEGMFTDMRISADLMVAFKDMDAVKNKGGTQLSMHVLTSGYWPSNSQSSCVLPAEVLPACELFKKFYLSRHTGRKITWQTFMGTAEIKAVFPNKAKHELIVSTYQMCVLLLFNSNENLSFQNIMEATNISEGDLKKTLLALSAGKVKVLRKEEPSENITPTELFCVNKTFSSKLYKVKILAVQSKGDNEAEAQENRLRIDEDRKHIVEAAIVRVMKARKTLDHTSLIQQVTELCSRFMPDPQLIKKRIESLIEREYLERTKKDRKVYNYLA